MFHYRTVCISSHVTISTSHVTISILVHVTYFRMNHLCMQPRTSVPEEKKDNKYWARRMKNNQAAKRSRDTRKKRMDDEIKSAKEAIAENHKLKQEIDVSNHNLSGFYLVWGRNVALAAHHTLTPSTLSTAQTLHHQGSFMVRLTKASSRLE